MNEYSIRFTDAEVRAVLAGTKTQATWLIKPQPTRTPAGRWNWGWKYGAPKSRSPYFVNWGEEALYPSRPIHSSYRHPLAECALWQPGDRLWVRECWMAKNWSDKECAKAGCPDAAVHPSETLHGFPTRAIYRASYNKSIGSPGAWKSSTQMPRWASRINLLVKLTWVKRVQDITEAEAFAAGIRAFEFPVPPDPPGQTQTGYGMCSYFPSTESTALQAYRRLWDSTNATRGCGWETNPWIGMSEFAVAAAKGLGE